MGQVTLPHINYYDKIDIMEWDNFHVIKKKVLKTILPSVFSISLKYMVKWREMRRIFSIFRENFLIKLENYKKILEKCEMSF